MYFIKNYRCFSAFLVGWWRVQKQRWEAQHDKQEDSIRRKNSASPAGTTLPHSCTRFRLWNVFCIALSTLPPSLTFHSCNTEGLWRAERQEGFFLSPWSYLTASSQMVLINISTSKTELDISTSFPLLLCFCLCHYTNDVYGTCGTKTGSHVSGFRNVYICWSVYRSLRSTEVVIVILEIE